MGLLVELTGTNNYFGNKSASILGYQLMCKVNSTLMWQIKKLSYLSWSQKPEEI